MNLYEITTHFWGKDLDEEASLGHVIAENDDGVYDHINEKHRYSEWPEMVNMTREEIIEAKGDNDSEYMGEFYDQKYGWKDLGVVSDEDIANLKRLKILATE